VSGVRLCGVTEGDRVCPGSWTEQRLTLVLFGESHLSVFCSTELHSTVIAEVCFLCSG